ncbi:MAG TPA: hypothetical protein VGI55_18325 [Solirubrobacteraceae bacterium]
MAKIRATVENAREVLVVLRSYGSIHAYLASFPDADAASADVRRRFRFLGGTGVWRLLIGAAPDIDDSGLPNEVLRRNSVRMTPSLQTSEA